MSVALSIVFTGLCALVTDGNHAPGEVLLVDAKGVGEIGGVTLPEHAPTLVVNLADLSNPDASNPTRVITAWPDQGQRAEGFADGVPNVDQIGIWDLTGAEVRIRVQGREPTGLELFHSSERSSSWPEPPGSPSEPAAWRDLRFVVSMDALTGDGRIDPALLSPGDKGRASQPSPVAARVYLDSGRLEAGMPSQEIHRDDLYEFRGVGPKPRLRQALTDSVRWNLETDTSAVIVEITPISGGSPTRLVFGPGARSHHLFVSNLPAENGSHHGHNVVSGDEMGFLHFGAYYSLLLNEPTDRPLPHLWRAPGADQGSGMRFRPICGGAMFRRR